MISSQLRPQRLWLLAVLVFAHSFGAAASSPSAPRRSSPAAGSTDAQPRLHFVETRDAAGSKTRYVAHTAGASVAFEPQRVVLTFPDRRGRNDVSRVLGLKFVGANPLPTIEGRTPGTGKVNLLVGRDASRWRRDLPTWREVVYRDLWPGIDMVFYGHDGTLKYEFHVRPGADAARIRLAYEGVQDASLDPSGAIQLQTPMGTMTDAAPVTWQDTSDGRQPVTSRFVKTASTEVGFAVGDYDTTLPLTIDPGLIYSTLFGGLGGDVVYGMSRGPDGSLFLAASTSWPAFLPQPQPYDAGEHANPENGVGVFVAKFSPDGRDLIYATVLSASSQSEQWPTGIVVDSEGAAYATGQLNSAFHECSSCSYMNDFPTTPGAYQTQLPEAPNWVEDQPAPFGTHAFVLKLSPAGSTLEYSTFLGGSGDEHSGQLALGPDGTVFVAGTTASTDFATTAGPQVETEAAFVVQLSPDGSNLIQSRVLQSSNGTRGGGLVRHNGSLYLTGQTYSPDLPSATDLRNPSWSIPIAAFVAKLSPATLEPQFITLLSMYGGNVAISDDGSLYVAGFQETPGGSNWTSDDAYQRTRSGGGDTYVAKLSADGSQLLKATYVGGTTGRDMASLIALDSSGDVLIAGATESNDYPTTAGAVQATLDGRVSMTSDVFVSRLSPDLTQLRYSTYLGGSGWDHPRAMITDANAVWVAGNTYGPGFPVTSDARQAENAGNEDVFLVRLDTTPDVSTGPNTPTGGPLTVSAEDGGASITFDNVTVAGITTLTPVDAASLSLAPAGGFAIAGAAQAYEISTTATASGFNVCLDGSALTELEFSAAVIMHGVNGGWKLEPTTRDYDTKTLCASVTSLSPFAIGVPVDTTAPSISCAAAPQAWSTTNVSIACTAQDAGVGLANAADAAFSLTTNVPPGSETANAPTDARQVCDAAGNCASTPVITGIKIDRKAPVATIAAPTNRHYILNEVVAAAFSCVDGGVVASCQGTAANGAPIDTTSVGAKTFTVTAVDGAGQAHTAATSYTVGYRVKPLGPFSVKGGNELIAAMQLTDAQGVNVSSSTLVATVVAVRSLATGTVVVLRDASKRNPDSNFQYAYGGYGYVVNTKGLPLGDYQIEFTVANDPTQHALRFTVVK
jgi:hypothetical protein